eukprot:TRINITY_DN9281_c0_g1_i1.p1 TRINITY_DN9281_c0_g1~~TRINITY_DN9281_c0_g1_i1.p1  ORF type:complete len:198 (+),score=31.84 TRINITY_DN9281_c0_g1_i1:44-637(+)
MCVTTSFDAIVAAPPAMDKESAYKLRRASVPSAVCIQGPWRSSFSSVVQSAGNENRVVRMEEADGYLSVEVHLPKVAALSAAAVHVTRECIKVPRQFEAEIPFPVEQVPTQFDFNSTTHMLYITLRKTEEIEADESSNGSQSSDEHDVDLDLALFRRPVRTTARRLKNFRKPAWSRGRVVRARSVTRATVIPSVQLC